MHQRVTQLRFPRSPETPCSYCNTHKASGILTLGFAKPSAPLFGWKLVIFPKFLKESHNPTPNTIVFYSLTTTTPLNLFQMASRTFSRALRSPLTKQLSAPARRTFVSAINASARPTARAVVGSAQQARGVKTIDFAGTKEKVYGTVYTTEPLPQDSELTDCVERADWPAAKLQVHSTL